MYTCTYVYIHSQLYVTVQVAIYRYIFLYACIQLYMLLIDLSAGVAGKYNFVPIITTRSQRLSLAKGTSQLCNKQRSKLHNYDFSCVHAEPGLDDAISSSYVHTRIQKSDAYVAKTESAVIDDQSIQLSKHNTAVIAMCCMYLYIYISYSYIATYNIAIAVAMQLRILLLLMQLAAQLAIPSKVDQQQHIAWFA